ncbi:MAG: hypothetical protein FJW31_12000 [Acidobacteria bacterium]|nr:hypothetical protein [Acidobacteriota bacterium]
MSKKSVCIVIGGHITSCPRMMKMAVALAEAGYGVSIVNPIYVERVYEADLRFLADTRWRGAPVKMVRRFQPWTYYRTGVRLRLARRRLQQADLKAQSLVALGRGYTRAFDDLLRNALAQPADLYLGGTAGGLAVAARAAELRGVPYALDLEDFHSAEQDPSPEADLSHALIAEIERRILPRAQFLTVGSQPMGETYAARYGVQCHPINNVFALPATPPQFTLGPAGRLQLVWLSQTLGPGRGIEAAIEALGRARIQAMLTVRGNPTPGYVEELVALAMRVAPELRLEHARPDMTKTVVELCRGNDVGLALEQAHILNRNICLCNKPFTYMLAGLAVAFTDTAGQRELARDLGAGALLFKIGDIEAQAAGFRHWAENSTALLAAKQAAWNAAVRRWHWEHPEERGQALALVRRALGETT